jgi:hypothetical protein
MASNAQNGSDTGFTLSRDPNKAMQEMMQVIDALRTLYVSENEALFAADTKKFLSLQPEKQKIADNYSAAAQQIVARSAEFKAASPTLRAKLKQEQEEFSRLADANIEGIERLQRGAKRFQGRIISAARDAVRKEHSVYTARGTMGESRRAVAMSIRESV